MLNRRRIDRINTLYHKSQAVGLTEEEKKEQAALRKECIESIRGNMQRTVKFDTDSRERRYLSRIWVRNTAALRIRRIN